MGGPNSEETKLVATWMRRELVAMIDSARWRVKRNRSQFIREAVAEKLYTLGLSVPPEFIYGDEEVEDPVYLETTDRVAEKPEGYRFKPTKKAARKKKR